MLENFLFILWWFSRSKKLYNIDIDFALTFLKIVAESDGIQISGFS